MCALHPHFLLFFSLFVLLFWDVLIFYLLIFLFFLVFSLFSFCFFFSPLAFSEWTCSYFDLWPSQSGLSSVQSVLSHSGMNWTIRGFTNSFWFWDRFYPVLLFDCEILSVRFLWSNSIPNTAKWSQNELPSFWRDATNASAKDFAIVDSPVFAIFESLKIDLEPIFVNVHDRSLPGKWKFHIYKIHLISVRRKWSKTDKFTPSFPRGICQKQLYCRFFRAIVDLPDFRILYCPKLDNSPLSRGIGCHSRINHGLVLPGKWDWRTYSVL